MRPAVETSRERIKPLRKFNVHDRWLWRLVGKLKFSRPATGGVEPCQLAPHLRLLPQVRQGFLQNRCRSRILRCHHAVVHPASLAPRRYDFGPAQISQVARNFRLADAEDFHEIADADFPVRGQIEQAEARGIGQGAEEQVESARFFCSGHDGENYICLDRYNQAG